MRHRISLIVALALVVPGCGGTRQIPAVPTVVAGADQNVRAAAIKALGILGAAGTVTQKALAVYQEASKVAPVPPEVDKTIRAGFNRTATAALAAIAAIDKGATSDWASLKAVLDPVLGEVQQLVTLVNTLSGQTRSTLRDWLDTILSIVSAALQVLPRSPLPEGV